MSDHEGGALDDWEAASLPGGFVSSYKGSSHQSLAHPIVSNQLESTYPHHLRNGYQPRPQSQFQAPEGYRPGIQSIPGIAHRSGGVQARREPIAPRRREPSASFIKYRSQVPADAEYQLFVPWSSFLRGLQPERNKSSAELAREHLDELCFKTDAYIATPPDDETKIPIWGTKEQVDRAINELRSFELYFREIGDRPLRVKWAKGNAFDGRSESRREDEDREKALAEGLRILSDETEYDFEAYFLWPDEIDIDRFITQHDSTNLKDIRGSILCKIDFVPAGIKHVKILATREDDLINIYNRLVNMVKEDIAQRGRFIVANRFRLPRAHMYRDHVGLDKDLDTNLYLATLHGAPLPEAELASWGTLCLSEDEKSRNLISNAVDMSLRSLQASQRHVRMRATFGELGFSQLELPPIGQESYTFDEFCAMMVKRRTTVQSMGIRMSPGDLGDLVDVLSNMKQFSEVATRYALHFDFEGRSNSTLRLEMEFTYPTTGARELALTSSRWLEYGAVENSEILEVSLLDFEHPRTNFQLHIGAIKLYTKSQADLHSFGSKVQFKPPEKGIKATPRRRAVYPAGRQDLRRLEEISIARFRFKEGNGYLELQRKDIYEEKGLKTVAPMTSLWSARYYYPEWDNILGQFASLEPGEDVRWARNLSTLFGDPRSPQDSKLKGLPSGFDGFMEEVLEISSLLQDGLQALPDLEANGPSGLASGLSGLMMD